MLRLSPWTSSVTSATMMIFVAFSLVACAKKHGPASADPTPHTGYTTTETDLAKDPILPVAEPTVPTPELAEETPEDALVIHDNCGAP